MFHFVLIHSHNTQTIYLACVSGHLYQGGLGGVKVTGEKLILSKNKTKHNKKTMVIKHCKMN